MTEPQPELPIDQPEEDEFDTRVEALEADAEMEYEMWRADGCPERK